MKEKHDKKEQLPEKYRRRNTHFVRKWGKTMEDKADGKIDGGDSDNVLKSQ